VVEIEYSYAEYRKVMLTLCIRMLRSCIPTTGAALENVSLLLVTKYTALEQHLNLEERRCDRIQKMTMTWAV
jgi:hypothetical protein